MNAIANPLSEPPVDSGLLPCTQPIAEVRIEAGDGDLTASRPDGAVVFAPAGQLRVIRGLRLNAEFPLYEGTNLIGRRDDRPVDVDLADLEPPDRVWSSRHHAMVTVSNGLMAIEDLNSTNGTFVNRHRVMPGQKRGIANNDVVQIGTIQFKVTTSSANLAEAV